MENRKNPFVPCLCNWLPIFPKKYGYASKNDVLSVLCAFVDDPDLGVAVLNKVRLAGNVFGREGFRKGQEVWTSDLTEIRRVCLDSLGENAEGLEPEDLPAYVVKTKNGSTYYLFDKSIFTEKMFADFRENGEESVLYKFLPRRFDTGDYI